MADQNKDVEMIPAAASGASKYTPDDKDPKEEKPKSEEVEAELEEKFKEEVEREVPAQLERAQKGELNEALDTLFALEKRCRMGEAVQATKMVACTIVQACVENKAFSALNDNLVLLSKRRGQFKKVVRAVVCAGFDFAVSLPSEPAETLENKLTLVRTLRKITEGKIYVENERARLTKVLSEQLETEGKLKEAAEMLQEVQVETYGSMETREKTEFILEQMRLTLSSEEYIRVKLLSSKIHSKILANEKFQDCKVKFYQLMIRFHLHHRDYLEVCRSYLQLFHTPHIQENEAEWKRILQLLIVYTVLSVHSPEQHDLLHRISKYPQTEQLTPFRDLLKYFTTRELICWPKLDALYKPHLEPLEGLLDTEAGDEIWGIFHDRVVEHNIRVVSEYYARIRLERLAKLLDLNEDKTEEYISKMVDRKLLYARIDRPKRVVGFVRRKRPAERLNDWADNVSSLLTLVEKNSHLIHRENVIAAAATAAK